MSFDATGFFFHEAPMISCIIVVNETDNSHDTLYRPTEDDVEKMCQEYDLSWPDLKKILMKRNPNVHTIFIEVNKFRQHCKGV